MRVFLAVRLPADLRESLGGLKSELALETPAVRWVRKESLHLTLRFLGEQPLEWVEHLVRVLAADSLPISPFPVSLEGIGCFPPKGSPRVVWVGTGEGGEKLAELFRCLEDTLARIHFSREARAFTPHLTAGRVKGKAHPGLRDILSRYRDRIWGRFRVADFALMESHLTSSGARYEALETFPLGIPGSEG